MLFSIRWPDILLDTTRSNSLQGTQVIEMGL